MCAATPRHGRHLSAMDNSASREGRSGRPRARPPRSAAPGRPRQTRPPGRDRTAGRCRRSTARCPGTAVSVSCTASSGACGKLLEIEPVGDRGAYGAQRAHLAARQPGCAQLLVAECEQCLGRHRPDGELQPPPDRFRARDRKLLADDDARQSRKARRVPAQRRVAGPLVHASQVRALAPAARARLRACRRPI